MGDTQRQSNDLSVLATGTGRWGCHQRSQMLTSWVPWKADAELEACQLLGSCHNVGGVSQPSYLVLSRLGLPKHKAAEAAPQTSAPAPLQKLFRWSRHAGRQARGCNVTGSASIDTCLVISTIRNESLARWGNTTPQGNRNFTAHPECHTLLGTSAP